MDIGDVRDGFAAVVGNIIDQARIYPVFPDPAQPPFITVIPQPFTYPATEDDKLDLTFRVVCVAGTWNSRVAQQILDGWISNNTPTSIIQAVRANNSLNGTCASAAITQLLDYGPIELQDGGTRLMHASLLLDVLE